MSSLLDMTNIPMTNILEKSDYKSILTLRKVCHSLRNFIDDACFKTDLDKIHLAIDPTGFSVRCYCRNALLPNGNGFAKDWTSNDLKIIMKMAQNSKLSYFSVNTNSGNSVGLDDLEEILKKQTRPLQTERFGMEGTGVLKVLPYLDSKTLKKISIRPVNYRTDNQLLEGIEKVMELEQFKNAVEIDINPWFVVRADVKKFFHFQRVKVNLLKTPLKEVVALKEAFVTSSHMDSFDLVDFRLKKRILKKLFGKPFHDPRFPRGGSQWFFKIQNCKEHVLRIVRGDALRFWKLEAKEVPKDAVVRN